MRTLRILPYPPSFPNLRIPITYAFFGSHTTPPSMCCCMVTFKACVRHGIVLVLLLENLATKSWTFSSLLRNSKPLEFHSPSSPFLKTHSKKWMIFDVLEQSCYFERLSGKLHPKDIYRMCLDVLTSGRMSTTTIRRRTTTPPSGWLWRTAIPTAGRPL
jgi:hypothetical protein